MATGVDVQYPEVIDISWRHNLRFDPRLGDEDNDEHADEAPGSDRRHSDFSRHVRIETPARSTPAPSDRTDSRSSRRLAPLRRLAAALVRNFPMDLQWIPANWAWLKFKPVIRSSILGFVSVMFMVIAPVQRVLGQATFLILIAAFVDPPIDSFVAVLEREIIFAAFVTLGWAWSCLGIFLANLARSYKNPSATFAEALTGQYIEAAPTVIMAIFVFFGVAFFLYIKVKRGPGPYAYPSVFGAVCVDISFVTAVLVPFPYYSIGQVIVLPLVLHSAICIFLSATVFPTTITSQYSGALSRLFDPLEAALIEHRAILGLSPSGPEFSAAVTKIYGLVAKSEAGLAPAAGALRLVKHDIIWGRFSPSDVGALQWFARRLVTRAHGLGVFFTLIDPTRERFPVTPVSRTPVDSRTLTPSASHPVTPLPSRPPSPNRIRTLSRSATPPGPSSPPADHEHSRGRMRHRTNWKHTPSASAIRRTISQHLHFRLRKAEEDDQHQRLHFSLLHLAHTLALPHPHTASPENAVGVFESQRYLALEATRLTYPDSPENMEHFVALLGQSCDDLLGVCTDTLKGLKVWVGGIRRGSFAGRATTARIREERLAEMTEMKRKLSLAFEMFKKDFRHCVLDPYRCAFDPEHVGSPDMIVEPPPHRYLFHCYVYQYHLMQFCMVLLEWVDEVIRMEDINKASRLWMPTIPLRKLFDWGNDDAAAHLERDDDEDPDTIPGMDTDFQADLGEATRRNPDALPPQNAFEVIMSWVHQFIVALGGGNVLFAMKAGLLTVILCIPNFLKHTAEFAYSERFIWGIFMGQLTLMRFRGDTTFALVARLMSTFVGGVIGMLLWYISAGRGEGNSYGFAATLGVCFPFFFYMRIYWPVPPVTNLIFFVTIALVLGFSWQNTHFPGIFHFYGFALAWRRFVLVVAGITAAFIFSLLPPSTTLRHYQRAMLSTTVSEMGAIYCSIVSFANTHGRLEPDKREIIQALLAIRMKLKRSVVLKTNIVYEFSLRGKWPAHRYQRILELQMQVAFHLSHLMSVVEHLDPAWSRAFLRRTRFLDADFQGDVLAVVSMISTALRTGNPLPQITPCPLLDRFMVHTHGLNIIRQEEDDDYGLPRTMTIDTLENEQYLTFAVGVTTAFGIILRLDKLMVATKELVGEQYHIHGVGVPDTRAFERPPKDA
ncbi:uncharacterized protein FIBRA_05622 [Fibroporia radiculosa]|uniref:ER transporter 6TM N-terminal domain-containing protein n=1 Tax=Fibroporia radiculosa TaxID=599839 RepID=J4G9U0_9APHY|nr:uncharacterized protein FIBRA_05622 [Fibroporia radiculosa]CCM03488.1 predicted protein [Fibroporia radiculosa]